MLRKILTKFFAVMVFAIIFMPNTLVFATEVETDTTEQSNLKLSETQPVQTLPSRGETSIINTKRELCEYHYSLRQYDCSNVDENEPYLIEDMELYVTNNAVLNGVDIEFKGKFNVILNGGDLAINGGTYASEEGCTVNDYNRKDAQGNIITNNLHITAGTFITTNEQKPFAVCYRSTNANPEPDLAIQEAYERFLDMIDKSSKIYIITETGEKRELEESDIIKISPMPFHKGFNSVGFVINAKIVIVENYGQGGEEEQEEQEEPTSERAETTEENKQESKTEEIENPDTSASQDTLIYTSLLMLSVVIFTASFITFVQIKTSKV